MFINFFKLFECFFEIKACFVNFELFIFSFFQLNFLFLFFNKTFTWHSHLFNCLNFFHCFNDHIFYQSFNFSSWRINHYFFSFLFINPLENLFSNSLHVIFKSFMFNIIFLKNNLKLIQQLFPCQHVFYNHLTLLSSFLIQNGRKHFIRILRIYPNDFAFFLFIFNFILPFFVFSLFQILFISHDYFFNFSITQFYFFPFLYSWFLMSC